MRRFLSIVLLAVAGCTTTTEPTEPGLDLDQIVSTARPGKRSEVIAVPYEEMGQILMFGGNNAPIVNQIPRAEYLDDTWIFEPGFGWTEIEGDGPHARGRHTAALDADGGRVLMFGGRYREPDTSGNYELFADLWSFDFDSQEWERLDNGTGGGPSARYYPQAVWSTVDQALYIWGGLTNADPLAFRISQELWRWTASEGWSEIPTSGDAPSPRAFVGTTYDSTRNQMILFAGQVGDFQSLAYNDLFALDLGTGEWRELHGGGSDAPFTRMHPHISYDADRDRVVLFGGHTDVGDDNDLWEWDLEGERWDLIREADTFTGVGFGCLGNPTEVPADYVEQDLDAPERRQKAFVTQMFDNLWVFGGMHAECSEHLDDTWRYDLASESWSELLEATVGESCLRRNDDCPCLCL